MITLPRISKLVLTCQNKRSSAHLHIDEEVHWLIAELVGGNLGPARSPVVGFHSFPSLLKLSVSLRTNFERSPLEINFHLDTLVVFLLQLDPFFSENPTDTHVKSKSETEWDIN